MSHWRELGHNHRLTRLANADGSLYGFVDDHVRPDTGAPCSGSVCVNPGPDDLKYGRDVWTVEREEQCPPGPPLAVGVPGVVGQAGQVLVALADRAATGCEPAPDARPG